MFQIAKKPDLIISLVERKFNYLSSASYDFKLWTRDWRWNSFARSTSLIEGWMEKPMRMVECAPCYTGNVSGARNTWVRRRDHKQFDSSPVVVVDRARRYGLLLNFSYLTLLLFGLHLIWTRFGKLGTRKNQPSKYPTCPRVDYKFSERGFSTNKKINRNGGGGGGDDDDDDKNSGTRRTLNNSNNNPMHEKTSATCD